jgi:hypothetical protein
MNTAAKGVYCDVDNINAKKAASFDHFQMNEAALWLSITSAQQDGSDYLELQKKHKKSVKLMDGLVTDTVTYFEKYTEHNARFWFNEGRRKKGTEAKQAKKTNEPPSAPRHADWCSRSGSTRTRTTKRKEK